MRQIKPWSLANNIIILVSQSDLLVAVLLPKEIKLVWEDFFTELLRKIIFGPV